MRIHFIAIGGSAMHNLAIALHKAGHIIAGSDDEIFEPSRSRLAAYGLLPENPGWYPDKLTGETGAVILGMHAREGNPELKRARELGIRIFSYPEFLYEHSKNKTRIVIGGSHGKTTITAIILHVLKHCGIDADYMIGAQLRGFDVMVKMSPEAGIIVLEGDEYLTSAIDPRPKFHLYRPHIALLSGIAWDHINVFPTWEGYISIFEKFVNLIEPGGKLIYCMEDREVAKIVENAETGLKIYPYGLPEHKLNNGVTSLLHETHAYPLKVFGRHNLMNIEGARNICREIGVPDVEFYKAIVSFRGADNRLERVSHNNNTSVFKDFAHSPSKLKATIEAVKEQFPGRELAACIELHTFSSLSRNFLRFYGGTMDSADIPLVYYNPLTFKSKNLPLITEEQVKKAFANENIRVVTDSEKLCNLLLQIDWKGKNLLLMSSGNFNNIPLKDLSAEITGNKREV